MFCYKILKILNNWEFVHFFSRQFIRKTFFSLAFCECCRRLLFTGLYCNQCNFRFHQRCGEKVPPLCHQINMDSYYQQLLAHNPESTVGILNPGNAGFGYQTRHPRSLNQQDRSNSAPNVCINNVKSIGDPKFIHAKGALQVNYGCIFYSFSVGFWDVRIRTILSNVQKLSDSKPIFSMHL